MRFAPSLPEHRSAICAIYHCGGGENVKRQVCLPCLLELEKAGKHNIQRVGGGVNMKITCWRCKRRRYGAIYEISRKDSAGRDRD